MQSALEESFDRQEAERAQEAERTLRLEARAATAEEVLAELRQEERKRELAPVQTAASTQVDDTDRTVHSADHFGEPERTRLSGSQDKLERLEADNMQLRAQLAVALQAQQSSRATSAEPKDPEPRKRARARTEDSVASVSPSDTCPTPFETREGWGLRDVEALREAVESGTGRDGQVDWPSVAAEMGESPARCRRRWESHTKPAGWAHVVRSNMPAEEPPAYAPTMYEARRSETIQNRRLQASDAVLRGRLRPVLNTPTARPAKPRRRDRVPLVGGDTRLARWQASYGIAAADWPEPGRPETCFRGITMTMHNGGDWTRMKLRSAGVTEEYWAPERIWAEIKAWVLVAKEDWRRHGEGGQPHRDRVRTLIIPQEAIVGYGDGESGDVIWDLRAMWTAAATGHVAPIVPLDVDADAEHRLNTARLRARLEQAGIGDSDAVEQLTAQGMRTDTTCRRDIVLHKNYPKAGEYAELCAALVEREAATSPGKPPIVSAASPVIDFVPTRSHPSNVVEGKKPRIVRDLRAPRNARDGGGENSVNAGIDLGDPDSFDPLELTSPLQFAAEVDILRAMMATGSLTVDIGTSDYARYYRQLMAALEDYWAQSFIIDAAGVRTDRATTFGGGAACHRGNEAADLLLELVVDEFTKTLAAFERQWDAGELTRLMLEARAVAGTQKDRTVGGGMGAREQTVGRARRSVHAARGAVRRGDQRPRGDAASAAGYGGGDGGDREAACRTRGAAAQARGARHHAPRADRGGSRTPVPATRDTSFLRRFADSDSLTAVRGSGSGDALCRGRHRAGDRCGKDPPRHGRWPDGPAADRAVDAAPRGRLRA